MHLFLTRRAGQSAPEGPIEPLGCRRSAFGEDVFREDAGGLDVGGVIQQHQGLLGDVGAWPFHGTLLPRWRVKSREARVQEAALPVGIETAAVEAIALVVLPLARREV